jgi:hypothetical protein
VAGPWKGAGQITPEHVATTLGNLIDKAMKPGDLAAVARERAGLRVPKPDGSPYDHVTEMRIGIPIIPFCRGAVAARAPRGRRSCAARESGLGFEGQGDKKSAERRPRRATAWRRTREGLAGGEIARGWCVRDA